ncbi:alpha/beta hydrolase [Capnocytophaga sp.]|uniref:alpha/beta hydrolase n=1 Tax=Capnocytophaga sp. TaxID=44737 RepID=UPI0026DCAF8A|nr:alpha/beta hydrolase-fold protein [Capnocytophaga sp.]MDO5104847.1 alpha/beta hydrolase-fold protein [Capnocytophaga sp.]
MKKLLLFFALLFLQNGFTQVISEEFNSNRLNGKRKIAIYLPEKFSEKEGYPLLVVLDAASLMESVIATTRYYEYAHNMPKCIVVGVFSTEEDVTVPHEVGRPMNESARFFEFVAAELVPYVQGKYPISNLKAVIGSDESGYLASHYLLSDKPLFNAVIALNPQVQPYIYMPLSEQFTKAKKFTFFYTATTDMENAASLEKIKTLNNQLKGKSNEYVSYHHDVFEGSSPQTTDLMGVSKAIDILFDAYKPISAKEFKEKIQPLQENIFEYIENKYNRIHKELGVKKKPLLNDILAIYDVIKEKEEWNSLLKLSDFVRANGYNETAMPSFFLGEFYENTNDFKRAVRAYQRAYGEPAVDFIKQDLINERITKLRKSLKKAKGKPEEEEEPAQEESEQTPTTEETQN